MRLFTRCRLFVAVASIAVAVGVYLHHTQTASPGDPSPAAAVDHTPTERAERPFDRDFATAMERDALAARKSVSP